MVFEANHLFTIAKVVEGTAANTPGVLGAVPPELHKAYLDGDYTTIQKFADISSNDFNPIYGNIQKNAEKAFFPVINPSDNTQYWLAIAGPADKPYGYMWTYCPAISSDGSTEQPVVQIGSYSANANTLWVSNSVWDNSIAQLAAGAIATVVITTTAKYIQKRILGLLVDEAVEEAVAEAGAELIAEEVVTTAAWETIAAVVGGVAVGLVAGALVFFLIMFIVSFVYKAYKVAVNIHNWDPNNAYVVDSWYGDNAIIDGSQAFSPIILPPPSGT
jgi:hypothetical protein